MLLCSPLLKDDKYHNIWHQSFKTHATAQVVSKVLDVSYVPTTPDSIALFQENQKYLDPRMEIRVLPDFGKAFIQDHEHDFDTKKFHQMLKAYHLQSTKAKMESSVNLLYYTSSWLGEDTWNGTTKAFNINWQNQIWLYKKHVPPFDHFSKGKKRIILQNVVNGITELQQVNINADQMGITSGTLFTYDEYATLLPSTASEYDDQFKATKSKRHVMLHEFQQDKACTDMVMMRRL
jgi:hypothetical protein